MEKQSPEMRKEHVDVEMPNAGEVYIHQSGARYLVIGKGYRHDADGSYIPMVRYLQLDKGLMPAGSMWSRSATEFVEGQSVDAVRPIFSKDTTGMSGGLIVDIEPKWRMPMDSEPARQPICFLKGVQLEVLGYSYDATGYEVTGEIVPTVVCRLLKETDGIAKDSIVEYSADEFRS